mgnify:FL=1
MSSKKLVNLLPEDLKAQVMERIKSKQVAVVDRQNQSSSAKSNVHIGSVSLSSKEVKSDNLQVRAQLAAEQLAKDISTKRQRMLDERVTEPTPGYDVYEKFGMKRPTVNDASREEIWHRLQQGRC